MRAADPHDRPDEVAALQRTINDLEAALVSSRTIGMAVGIVMKTYSLTPADALCYLQHRSQNGNIKVITLAARIVYDAQERLPAQLPCPECAQASSSLATDCTPDR